MDSLTQIVLGAAVGELVLGKKVGNKAILWGAIAGTIPDLDVLNRVFFDDLRANELHRGVTHSIFFSSVMAPILGRWVKSNQASLLSVFVGLVMAVFFFGTESVTGKSMVALITLLIIGLVLWKMKGQDTATAKDWSWLFWWSLVTHPLLDCHTTWGTQLFWPLPLKVAFNNIFVVDPMYTVPFLICVTVAMFLERTDPRRRWINKLGLVISTAYMALTILFKFEAHRHIRASVERQGIAYSKISTRPTPFNAILWTTNVNAGDHYELGYYSLLDTKPDVDFVRIPKNHQLLGPWADHENVKRLTHLSDDNYVIQLRNDTLVFCDLRFGQMGAPTVDKPFVYSYQLIPNGTQLDVKLLPPRTPNGEQFSTILSELWTRVKGES